jgi:hypothetical protein
VDFPNFDPIFHNAFSNYNGQIFDIGLYAPGTTKSIAFRREGVVRVFCNIHPTMSAVIVVLKSPYFATSEKNGGFQIANVARDRTACHVFHERAAEETLAALTRTDRGGGRPARTPADSGVRKRLSRIAAQEQVWEGLSAGHRFRCLRGCKAMTFSRLSLLWKILIPISLVMTLSFAITVGWLVQRDVIRASYASVEEEAKASFQAYESLWKARASRLAAVSEILSTMSDVRAAFGTKDPATIRDTAGELWSSVSREDAFFLVADGQGRVVASLGSPLPSRPTTICRWFALRSRSFPNRLPALYKRAMNCSRWWSRPSMCSRRRARCC